MYVSILLPRDVRNTPWTILGVHDTTTGIFESIATNAAAAGFVRDAERSNVYRLGDTECVGWWTTLDSFYDELALRDRLGAHELSDAMREALRSFDVDVPEPLPMFVVDSYGSFENGVLTMHTIDELDDDDDPPWVATRGGRMVRNDP